MTGTWRAGSSQTLCGCFRMRLFGIRDRKTDVMQSTQWPLVQKSGDRRALAQRRHQLQFDVPQIRICDPHVLRRYVLWRLHSDTELRRQLLNGRLEVRNRNRDVINACDWNWNMRLWRQAESPFYAKSCSPISPDIKLQCLSMIRTNLAIK